MQALRLVSTTDLPREDWLKIRRRGIGGSDISVIAGVNPFRSAMSVFLEKINELPEQEDNEKMHWGRVLESVVATEFARQNNAKLRKVNAVLQHPEHPMLLANIDRMIMGNGKGNGILEIKTTSAYMQKEWEDEKIPDWVLCQVQHYLGVTGLPYAYVAALIGGNKYIQYPVERDEEVIGYLQKIALDFWKLVESRTPPEIDGSKTSSEILGLLYPKARSGEMIDLQPGALELITEFEAAQAEEKAAAERKDAAANKLKMMLGESETGLIGERKVTWKTISQSRLDGKKLQTDHPDIYERYCKQSEYRRFMIK